MCLFFSFFFCLVVRGTDFACKVMGSIPCMDSKFMGWNTLGVWWVYSTLSRGPLPRCCYKQYTYIYIFWKKYPIHWRRGLPHLNVALQAAWGNHPVWRGCWGVVYTLGRRPLPPSSKQMYLFFFFFYILPSNNSNNQQSEHAAGSTRKKDYEGGVIKGA